MGRVPFNDARPEERNKVLTLNAYFRFEYAFPFTATGFHMSGR